MKKIKMNINSIGMWIVLVTIVGLVAFSGCTDQEEINTEKTDTEKIEIEQKLVIAEPWGISGVDPAKEGGTLNNFLVLDTLTVMEPDFSLVPGLAKSWELIDNTTWRIYLKDNIKFHDNTGLTADDVTYSFERNMEINPTIRRDLGIKSIEKIDDYTIDITTEKPDAAIPAALSYAKAVIYSKNSVESNGIIIKPIGTGPFKFEKYNKATDILELSKYEDHWNGAPKLDTVLIQGGVGEASTRELAIEKGEVDFTTEPPLGSTEILKGNPEFNVMIHPLCQGYKLNFGNLSKAPYDDIKVRKAIAYAVDKESIVEHILYERGEISNGMGFVPGIEWRNNDLTGYPYDPQKSKQLLKEAGWEDTDNDGILDKDGKAFKMTLYTWPQRPALPPLAETVQSQFKEIGIDAEVRIMDWSAIKEHLNEWGAIRVSGGSTCMRIPDPSYYLERHFYSEGTSNSYGYKNEEVDLLLDEGRSTFDKEKRYDIYREVQEIVVADVADVYIAYHNLAVVTKSSVKGYVPNPSAHDYRINPDIYIEK